MYHPMVSGIHPMHVWHQAQASGSTTSMHNVSQEQQRNACTVRMLPHSKIPYLCWVAGLQNCLARVLKALIHNGTSLLTP